MDSSPSALLRLFVPRMPWLFKTALWHTFSLSDTSDKWDLKTELTIKFMRDLILPGSNPRSITKQQKATLLDPGVKGRVWASKVKLAVPEDGDLTEDVFKAVEEMATGEEIWTKPEAIPLEAEWNGYRAGVSATEPEPTGLNEKDKYDNLLKETSSKVTILLFHGGAMYMLDPATYRPITSRLAKETGGRVFSVRYRLSPKNPFPAALLDCLTSYLSLLYPPADAPHEPIPASEIVFHGDSAGGMCCMALLQLLLQMHRTAPAGQLPKVRFHGRDLEVPLPAGIGLSSPWLDASQSLPSWESQNKFDYLPAPSATREVNLPPCDIWPAEPARSQLYCDGSMLLHPLVSPLAAKDWTKSPPIFISVGEERLRDEVCVVAQRMAKQGVPIVWRDFEAMPHCFPMIIDSLPTSNYNYDEEAKFCQAVVGGAKLESNAHFIRAKTLEKQDVDVTKLIDLTDDQVDEIMRKEQINIEEIFQKMQKERKETKARL